MVFSWLFGSSNTAKTPDNKTLPPPSSQHTEPIAAPARPAQPAPSLPAATPPAAGSGRITTVTHFPDDHVLSRRSLRQLGLFVGGAGFFCCSVLITRRAVARHQLAAQLRFFQPNQLSGRTQAEAGRRDPAVAVEALALATVNTLSFAVMAAGGVSWAFDISSVDDLRRITRRSIGPAAGNVMVDEEEEREVVEWLASTFGLGGKPGGGEGGGGGGSADGDGKRDGGSAKR